MKPLLTLVLLLSWLGPAAAQSKFSCRDWSKLPAEKRQRVMEQFIALAKAQNIVLKLPADSYVCEVDALVSTYAEAKNDNALDGSIGVTVHTVAAMEGDWGNGEDKLEHAKKWMGAEAFDLFKRRYPDKHRRLAKGDGLSKAVGIGVIE